MLKKIPYFLTLILFSFTAFAAEDAASWCGSDMPDGYSDYYFSKDRSYLDNLNTHNRGGILYVPIQYHIVGEDNGFGYYEMRDLLEVHCRLNERFERANIYFYLHDDVNYIPNSNYYSFSDYSVSDQMKAEHNRSAVCNVYIVEEPRGVCGFATFPGWGQQGIVNSKSCSGPSSTTLAHEMGHYLGLPHTFSTNGGIELINGSNCRNAGDGFCDTPADFLDYRWSCPYTGGETDPNGELYRNAIDETLYMSYSSDNCQARFSLEQEAEMRWTIENRRSNHLSHAVPDVSALTSSELIFPPDEAEGVSPDYVNLRWKSVPGATHYQLVVTRFSNPNFANVDMVLTDTTFTVSGLQSGFTYRWRVKPWNRGNVCAGFTAENHFRTSPLTAEVFITEPACNGYADGAINVQPTGGQLPYNYEWSTGDQHNPVTDLAPGDYTVSITDADGEALEMTITVVEPELLTAEFEIGESNVLAMGMGGTAPYSYVWSDGTEGNTAQIRNSGEITVTITDANGCVSSKTLTFTGTETIELFDADVSVFPNPLKGSNNLTVRVAVNASTSADLNLIDMNGSLIASQPIELRKGQNELSIESLSLKSGVYILQLKSEKAQRVTRFTKL